MWAILGEEEVEGSAKTSAAKCSQKLTVGPGERGGISLLHALSVAPSIATQVISIYSGETQCSWQRQNIEVNSCLVVATDDGPENKVLEPDSLP